MAQAQPDRLIAIEDVLARVPISRATLYRWIDQGAFPKPRKVRGRTFWRDSAVAEWLAADA